MRDVRSMPLIYWVPIALALAFSAVVALDGGGFWAIAVWWPVAALGALSLADKPLGRRVLLTGLMFVVCLMFAIAWMEGNSCCPRSLALLIIDGVRATVRIFHRKTQDAPS